MPKVTSRYHLVPAQIRKAAVEAMQRAATSHVEVAKQLAPVDTGFMRENIEVQREVQDLTVVSEASYSAYVEFGTANADAQPFFLPAFESAVRQFNAEIAETTRKALG